MIERARKALLHCIAVASFGAAAGSAHAGAAADLWAFTNARCLLPMENVQQADAEGLRLSAAVVALIPGLTSSALAWESGDGRFFLSRDTSGRFAHCSAGLFDPGLRRDVTVHKEFVGIFEELAGESAEARYTALEDEAGPLHREILLESTIWREPRLQLRLHSDLQAGRLHIFVFEIDKEA